MEQVHPLPNAKSLTDTRLCIGHFALTIPLLPVLKETASKPGSHVRIVNLTSIGSQLAQKPNYKTLDDLNQQCWSTWNRYGNAKLSVSVYTSRSISYILLIVLSEHALYERTSEATGGNGDILSISTSRIC